MEMLKKSDVDYTLYLCTDRDLMSTDTLEEAVEQAILGGCSLIQLREKHSSSREFFEMATRIKAITDKYQVPLIINDRIDIAMAVDAAGVHLGQSDLPAREARRIMGEDKIIGVSARNVELAVQAVNDGADYLGVGAMFATGTKGDAKVIGKEKLKEIRAAVSIPIVAIGGIHHENAAQLRDTGVNGLAVVSAVIGAKDIRLAAKQMREIFTAQETEGSEL